MIKRGERGWREEEEDEEGGIEGMTVFFITTRICLTHHDKGDREIGTALTQNTCLVGVLHHGQLSLLSGEEFLSLLQHISPCYFLTLVQNGESRKKAPAL